MLIKDGILPLVPSDGCDGAGPCLIKEMVSTCLDTKPNSTFVFLPLFLSDDTLKVPFEGITPTGFADLTAMIADLGADDKFKVLGMPQGQMNGIAERDAIKTIMKDLINGNTNISLWWDKVRQKMESLMGLNIMCYAANKQKLDQAAAALPNLLDILNNLATKMPILKDAATNNTALFDTYEVDLPGLKQKMMDLMLQPVPDDLVSAASFAKLAEINKRNDEAAKAQVLQTETQAAAATSPDQQANGQDADQLEQKQQAKATACAARSAGGAGANGAGGAGANGAGGTGTGTDGAGGAGTGADGAGGAGTGAGGSEGTGGAGGTGADGAGGAGTGANGAGGAGGAGANGAGGAEADGSDRGGETPTIQPTIATATNAETAAALAGDPAKLKEALQALSAATIRESILKTLVDAPLCDTFNKAACTTAT